MVAMLMSKRIPESRAKVVEVRAGRIALDGITAAQIIDRDEKSGWHARQPETSARPRFNEVGPRFSLLIHGHVAIPVQLRLEEPERRRVTEAVLGIKQRVVV